MIFLKIRTLLLGTRDSPLALAQAGWVAAQSRERCGRASVPVELILGVSAGPGAQDAEISGPAALAGPGPGKG